MITVTKHAKLVRENKDVFRLNTERFAYGNTHIAAQEEYFATKAQAVRYMSGCQFPNIEEKYTITRIPAADYNPWGGNTK